jgi:hypothetical protein
LEKGEGGLVRAELSENLSGIGLDVKGGGHRVCLSDAGIQFGGIATTSPTETGFPDSMAHLNANLSVLSLQSASE